MAKRTKVLIQALGCKVNRYDAEALGGQLRGLGLDVVEKTSPETSVEPVDICILFTCSVTAESDRKSRQGIRQLIRNNPDALVVAASCYAEIRPEELREIPGVDMVIGTSKLEQLPRTIAAASGIHFSEDSSESPLKSFRQRTRAFVKIQDGCDQFCAYCQIPYTRGRPRSRKPASVLEEIGALVGSGHPEVVLCGIRLGAFGRDLGEDTALTDLLHALDEIPGLVRYRLSSIEPNDISEEMIGEFRRLKKLAPHFHIPLQSGVDSVLKRMNRKYNTREYEALIDRLREAMPSLAVSTDLLVGFPGETEQEFAQTKDFIEKMMFSKVHLFPFSCRPVTAAAQMKQSLSKKQIKERRRELMAIAARKATEFKERFLGRSLSVLPEDKRIVLPEYEGELQLGYSENYLRVAVEIPEGFHFSPGMVYSVHVVSLKGNLLIGLL